MLPLFNKYNLSIETLLCAILTLSLIGIPASTFTTPAFGNFPNPSNPVRRSDSGDVLPLSFELNQGQTNERVRFLARSEGYVLFLTATEAVMALDNPSAHQKGKENRELHSRAKD